MSKQKKEVRAKGAIGSFLIASLILLGSAILLGLVLRQKGYYASGCDAWGHLFKGDLMYKSLKQGQFYPLYTPLWYNGLQPYRYWAPFPYYLLALLEYIGGGIDKAYYLFAVLSLFVGGLPWVIWGKQEEKIGVGLCLAVAWFFMPENTRVFFCEGNIPRMVTAIIIPWLVLFIKEFVEKEKDGAVTGIVICMSLITLSHVMIAAMMGIGTFLFLVFFMIKHHKYLRSMIALVGMVIAIILTGIWLIPALSGGLVGMNQEASSSVMASLSYDLSISLNPMNRIHGIVDTFYYGLSVVIISIIGILLSKKNDRSGYITALLILAMTMTAFVPILSKLPLSQLLWMMRFATIAYAFFFWSLLEWRTIRKYFSVILLLILVADCIPSLNLDRYYTQMEGKAGEEIEIAKSITKQRVALLDLSTYGSYASYELCEGEDTVSYAYGWAWQGAATAPNIVLINTAVEKGYYLFAFSRTLQLGCDTVLIPKNIIENADKNPSEVIKAAKTCGYKLYKETEEMYVFHRDLPENFYVRTQYEGIGIGSYANTIQLKYPNFTYGTETDIDHYSFEELSKYKVVFLSGFTYENKEAAQSLTQQLAKAGVKVVIDATHLPVDKTTRRMTFMGVTAEDITFTNQYPTLVYKRQQVIPEPFAEGYETWHTKYIEGVKKPIGESEFAGQKMTFLGTSDNENIIWIGFNLYFHGLETEDTNVLGILSDVMGMPCDEVPQGAIGPMTITYDRDQIIIDKQGNESVNTTLAYQDNFSSEQEIVNHDHLLYVTSPHTVIQLTYPHFKLGLITSLVGLISFIGLRSMLIVAKRKRKFIKSDQEEIEENITI